MKKRLPEILAALGGLVFLTHAAYYALTQISVLDEGGYLMKGLLFVRGVYAPFQDYGPETNHMPLSFLIHGAVQALFGPGLREGRYFTLFVGLILALGLFVLVRKLRGPWWAAGAVWLLAINPATARFYSLATSQTMIAAMMIWVLVLAVPGREEERVPIWKTTAAAALAGAMLLTRINLAPVVILVVLYVFWTQGRAAGWWALAAGGFVVAGGHALFWPEVLKLWAHWLPQGLTPFLDPWRRPDAQRFWDPQVTAANRFFSLLEGLRLHFFSMTGFILAFFYPPGAETRPAERKTFALLVALYAVLLAAHAAASIGLDYCVYCFSVYTAFFAPVGLALLVLILSGTLKPQPARRAIAVAIILFTLATLIGLGAHESIGDSLAGLRLPRVLSWLRGEPAESLPVWDVLQNRIGWEYPTTRKFLAAGAGAAAGLAVIAAAAARRRGKGFGFSLVAVFLLAGLILTPTQALGNGFRTYDCGVNVLDSLETAGGELAARIPPGTEVFWEGGDSIVPLLYVPGAILHAPQINGDYTIYDLDDADALLRFGLYNDALTAQWLREADVVLIESVQYKGELKAHVLAAGLEQTGRTSEPYPCLSGSEILVFESP